MAIESALIPVCLPLIQFSLKQPERFVQRNRTKIIKNVSALRLGLQHTRFRSAFDDPPIIEQMPGMVSAPRQTLKLLAVSIVLGRNALLSSKSSRCSPQSCEPR